MRTKRSRSPWFRMQSPEIKTCTPSLWKSQTVRPSPCFLEFESHPISRIHTADRDIWERVLGSNPSMCVFGNLKTPALLRNRGLRKVCLPTFLLSRELQNAFHCGALVVELIADLLYPMQGYYYLTTGLLRWAAVMFGCWEERPLPRKYFTAWVKSLEATVERLREETREYQNDGVLPVQRH